MAELIKAKTRLEAWTRATTFLLESRYCARSHPRDPRSGKWQESFG